MKSGPAQEELVAYGYARRSIHAAVDIGKGTVITEDMLMAKRPGHGIRPKYMQWVIGRRAALDIPGDSWITMEMLD